MAIACNRSAMTVAKDKNALDAPEIGPESTPDEVLDAAIEYTFPASDPIAVETAYRMAARRSAAQR